MGIDAEWDAMNSRRAHDNFRLIKLRENQERRDRREKQDRPTRLKALIADLTVMQHARVLSVERSSSTADSLHLPTIDEGIGFLDPKETKRWIRDLSSKDPETQLAAIEQLEKAIDAHKGYHTFEANLTGDQKNDRIIHEYEGVDPATIIKLEPSLGDVQTIRSVRENQDRDPDTGALVDNA